MVHEERALIDLHDRTRCKVEHPDLHGLIDERHV
jgi:hypothetical protein